MPPDRHGRDGEVQGHAAVNSLTSSKITTGFSQPLRLVSPVFLATASVGIMNGVWRGGGPRGARGT